MPTEQDPPVGLCGSPGGQPFCTPRLWLLCLPGHLRSPGKEFRNPQVALELRERERPVLGISSPKSSTSQKFSFILKTN